MEKVKACKDEYKVFSETVLEDIAVHEKYDRAAEFYDRLNAHVGYVDNEMVAKSIDELYTNKGDIKVIDYACGSGACGTAMAKVGVKNIVGLDASGKMLEIS